ncbi:MAG TPA: hypothetical protein VIY48_21410, partial [Candidatus Paceibacterota bacterium]
MATYYVDYGPNGNDTNPGTFAAPFKNWKKGIDSAAFAGDKVRIIASGTPVVIPSADTITVTNHVGTSFSNPGLTIEGVSATDGSTPALAEVRFQDDAVSQVALTLSTNCDYIIVQGIKVNWSNNVTAMNGKAFVRRSATSATNIRVQYNYFKGKNTVGGIIYHEATTTAANMGGEFRYNYVENVNVDVIKVLADRSGKCYVYNNVFVVAVGGGTAATGISCGTADGTSTDHRFYNNTIVVR